MKVVSATKISKHTEEAIIGLLSLYAFCLQEVPRSSQAAEACLTSQDLCSTIYREFSEHVSERAVHMCHNVTHLNVSVHIILNNSECTAAKQVK